MSPGEIPHRQPDSDDADDVDQEVASDHKADIEAGQITTAADWTPSAADDPGNPHNWSTGRKLRALIVPPCVGFLCPFGSSVYTPALEQVRTDLHVTRELALLPFVFYLLGLSFGPVLAAPLSETLGRKIVYLGALPIFAAFTIGAGFSQNITSLTILRFFAGMSSSPGLSLGSGTVADCYPPHKRGLPMALFVTSVQLGPVLGPLIGGFVTETKGWRWTQWVMLFGIAIVLALTLFMPETYKMTILRARAKRYGVEGPPEPQRTRVQSIQYFAQKTVSRPIVMLFTEPIITFFDIYTAFTFGLLNAFFAAFSWVFQTVYGFGIGSTGLTYLGQLVGSIAGLVIILFFQLVVWRKQLAQLRSSSPSAANIPPESRLILAKIGAPLLPASLFWFGWTARPSILWLSPVAAEGLFSCANLLIFTSALLFLQDCYGARYSASAVASNTFLRYLASFAFPLFAIQMYEALGVAWATSLLAFVALLLLPIPFVFHRFGERMRAKSHFHPDG